MLVFCCLCVFLYFNHYITLYYSFQFNIIIHTHGSPGWLLLISFLLLFSFLSFLRGSWFSVCWFPFFLILSPLLLLSPQFCLICICGTLARALSRPLLFTLVSVVVVDVCCCMLSSSFLTPPRTRKPRKKNLRPASLLSLLLYLYTHNHAPVVVLVKLSGWRSSAGWTASPGPRTDRRRWLRTLPECTSCGSAASAGPACR